jgi:hypothetical protein
MDGVITDLNKKIAESGIDKQSADLLAKGELKGGHDIFVDIANNGGLDFWTEMEWMPNGKKLWNEIKKYRPTILSAYGEEVRDVVEGKRIWIKKNLGDVEYILCQRVEKQKYSNPNSVLIDDRDTNIIEWKDKGGIGIIYSDDKCESVIKEVRRYFSHLKKMY